MEAFGKEIDRRAFLKLASGLAIALVLTFTASGDKGNGSGKVSLTVADFWSPVPWRTFFHAQGRDIVADSTGEKVFFRGVNLNGLEFGTFFDNPYPGELGKDYFAPRPKDFRAVKALGFNVIRVLFEWARLVPGWQPGEPLPTELDPAYLGILNKVIQRAAANRLYVILDMHDFLKYWSGQSVQVCVDTSPDHQQLLAHTWKLLATHFGENPALLGYDIMNEPVRQEAGELCSSCNWHAIAQSVVDAVRTVDEKHLIFVEGPNFSLASAWPIENGKIPFITDRVIPARTIYSPHVFFDFNNDSRYDQPGEETGPIGQWEYYVRDRLMPTIDWSIDNNVPIFIGETNVPCTADWADVLEHAFVNFFDPLHLSLTAWHYINPAHCPPEICPLNLAACPILLKVLKRHPGGVWEESGSFIPTPFDSRIYDDVRVNPWDAGEGFFGDLLIDFCANNPVCEGDCSLSVHFNQSNFAGVKFIHHYGLDTRRLKTFRFCIFLSGMGQQNFKIFTTAPRSDCDPGEEPIYPPTFDEQPELRDFLPLLSPGQWQQVEIPLEAIVDPKEPIINGIAFQNMGTSQEVFYLDDIHLIP